MTAAAFASLESYKLTEVNVSDRQLGIGSTAIVIELEYMGMKCAGKKILEVLLKSDRSTYIEASRRFSKECHFLSRINHSNVVQFYGVYFQQTVEVPILVLEFLPTDLTSCIKEHGVNLPKEICYSILYDIAQGLLYLHQQHPPIIHRDLSSNNILLTPTLTAKIADLGVARILNMSPLQVSTMTQTPGTLTYMPPEVMVETPRYNTSIDEFSYGILIIYILCGRSPEPQVAQNRKDEFGRLIAVSEAERREKFLKAIGTEHPLMKLILGCIDNDPQLRPSASEIVQQLEEKVTIIPPSFKQRLETLSYMANREVKDRKGSDKRKTVKKKINTVHIPTSYLWMAAIVPLIAIFIAYSAGRFNGREEQKMRNTAKVYIQTGIEQYTQSFVNTTFEQCAIGKTLKCDTLVQTIIRDLGRISWKRGKDLQTSMYQGQSVVIDYKVCFGGGLADIETHKYIVYCYDPRQDNWTALSPLPVKSFGLGKFRGKLVAVGGVTEEGNASSKVYTFDNASLSWTPTVIPSMQISRMFPGVLSLPSALVISGGGQSIEIYTEEKGWYWSNQPLPIPCTDVTLVVAGSNCYALGANYTKELLLLDWTPYNPPLSLYVSTEDILWDRNKTVPGMAYEYRDKLIFPSYRWKELPGGTQAYSLVATVLAGNLLTLGKYGQRYDKLARMYSLSNESWCFIGELPDNFGGATITTLSSTNMLVTGKKQNGILSVYMGSVQLFH